MLFTISLFVLYFFLNVLLLQLGIKILLLYWINSGIDSELTKAKNQNHIYIFMYISIHLLYEVENSTLINSVLATNRYEWKRNCLLYVGVVVAKMELFIEGN